MNYNIVQYLQNYGENPSISIWLGIIVVHIVRLIFVCFRSFILVSFYFKGIFPILFTFYFTTNPCPLTLLVLLVKNMMAPPTIATNKIIPNIIKNICHQNHHSQLWQVNRKSLFGHFKTFLGKTTVSQVVQSLIASWKKFGNDSYIQLQNSSFPQVLQ